MTFTVRVVQSIEEIPAPVWNRCANPPGRPSNPFVDHAFLLALEKSGSVAARTGWQPFHVVLERAHEESSGEICGVMPAYLKNHSRGEYVFDHSWAEAYHRAGGRYYPKLQSSVPFTPVTGPRLLTADGGDDAELKRALLTGAVNVAEQVGVSSLHLTFLESAEWELASELGLLQRMDQQFHFVNEGYSTFDDFLAALASKKRKNVRRERRDALATGIEVEWVTGSDLSERHWDVFFEFYMDTGSRKWGSPYLNRQFFSLVGEWMPERVLLVMARRRGRYVAGALNFIGSDALYGRNWGAIEDHPFLHFELCYYQAIDFAIAHQLARVEAGAQGAHKIARGYVPTPTYSAHWIRDAGFRHAVARYLKEETRQVRAEIDYLAGHAPFRAEVAEPPE